MRVNYTMLKKALIVLSTIVAAQACSGGDDAEEPVSEPSEGGEEAAAPAEEAPAAENEAPAAEPADDAATADAAAPAASAEPTGFTGAPVTRYVRAFALNVRGGPGKDFPVKRHVKYGEKIQVTINGEWAKLGEGEYVSTNRLAEKQPKKGRYK